jgi:hypothetical protein
MCPSAIGPWKRPLMASGAPLAMGLAGHELLKLYRLSGHAPSDDTIRAVAAKHGVDVILLADLWERLLAVWRTYEGYFAGDDVEFEVHMSFTPAIDTPLGRLQLTGQADVCSATAVWDDKTGWSECSTKWQLEWYAYLRYALRGGEKPRKGITCYHRTGEVVVHDLMSAADFEDAVIANAERIGTHYNPAACDRCPGRNECQANRDDLTTMGAMLQADASLATPQDLIRLWPRLQKVEAACRTIRSLADRVLAEAGGEIDLGNGSVLRLETRRVPEVDTLKAFPLVMQALGNDQDAVAQCMTLGLTALREQVKARAGKGEKGRAAAAVVKALEEAGALAYTERAEKRVRESA